MHAGLIEPKPKIIPNKPMQTPLQWHMPEIAGNWPLG